MRLDARKSARALGRQDRNRRLSRPRHSFDRAMASFAETYADQNERNHAAPCRRQPRPAASSPRWELITRLPAVRSNELTRAHAYAADSTSERRQRRAGSRPTP